MHDAAPREIQLASVSMNEVALTCVGLFVGDSVGLVVGDFVGD